MIMSGYNPHMIKNKNKLIFAVYLLMIFFSGTALANVELDNLFGADGLVQLDSISFTAGVPEVSSISLLNTGEITIAGYDTENGLSALVNFTDDGQIDNNFGPAGVVSFDFGNFARITGYDRYQNIILASGNYNNGEGGSGGFIAKYDNEGLLDSGFSGDGLILNTNPDVSFPVVLVGDSNYTIAIGYNSDNDTSSAYFYDGNGSLINLYGDSGVLDLGIGRVYAAKIDADGRIIAVGNRNNDSQSIKIWAFSQLGVMDSTFGINGVIEILYAADTNPVARAVTFSSDGKIYIAGSHYMSETVIRRGFITRLNEDGDIDASFGDSGTVATSGTEDEVSSLAYLEDGTLLASGKMGGLAGAIFAYNEEGSLDTRFDDDGIFNSGINAGGDSFIDYESGTLVQTFADSDRSNIVVAQYSISIDQDGDSVYDILDNCPEVSNVSQADIDEDGIGDACDPTNDNEIDGDEESEEPAEENRRRKGSSRVYRPFVETTAATTTPTLTPTVIFTRDLFVGSTGDDVRALQELLIIRATGPAANSLAGVGATGYFGEYTRAAVAELQNSLGVTPAVGYFGPITRTKMKNIGAVNLWW